MKMKSKLTENGIYSLYSQSHVSNVKVQVLYVANVNSTTFIRVTDAKIFSPIIVLLSLKDSFIVGDIILLKKVQVQSAGLLKDAECLPLLDSDLNILQIIEYQVVESRSNVTILCRIPNSHVYWESLRYLKNYLVKKEGMAETYFNDVEKRMKLLQPDCNLLRERGNELFKNNKYMKAILHYDMAKQKDQYDARVWNNASQVYYLNNDYEKAKRDALVALKLDPFNTKAYYRAGQAINSCGDHDAAIEIIEAGLYVCEKSDDLKRLLESVLEEKKNKEGILSASSNKKKNLTTNENSVEPLPESVPKLNGTISSKKKSKSNNSTINKTNNENNNLGTESKDESGSTDSIKQDYLQNSLMEGAKGLYEKQMYVNALQLLEVVVKNNNAKVFDNKEFEVMSYLIAVCKINSSTKNTIEQGKYTLLTLCESENFPYPAAVHYWLAITFKTLEKQDKVIHHANTCGLLLRKKTKYNLFWPSTQDSLKETSPEELKQWFMESSWRATPSIAKCRHSNCVSVQGHGLAYQEIYSTDFDFRGYIEVECEEVCSIVYHPGCWKAIVKDCKDGQLSKKTDKDFLGMTCFTPDCFGKICSIRTFDENSQLKNETARDRKEKKNVSSVKAKKKKEKKKNDFQKYEDKKKKSYEAEEQKLEEITIVTEETVLVNETNQSKQEQIDFEGSDYKILRPDEDDNEFKGKKSKNKTTKKKKTKKQLAQIPIMLDEVEERVFNNEYLMRLKALKVQREAMECDTVNQRSSNDWSKGLTYLPDCVLDPENPFYLPQHLQNNPDQLEAVLRNKMMKASSSEIEPETINTLLEFMYESMKAQSPMNINDSRIRDFITEYFPPNAVSYVNKCGGIKSFLLQSFRFAIIDDIICVNEQVVSAQNMAVQILLDKFRSSKYLIRDGHKAVKYSHLLDDTKSTCSTNSSQSNVVSATSSSDSNLNGVSTSDSPASSMTPYKNAAMAQPSTNHLQTASDQASKPRPNASISGESHTKKEVGKKSKLKTMDIDDFEDIGKMFCSGTSKSSHHGEEKRLSVTSDSEMFHSEEDVEINTSKVNELKEIIKQQQEELESKDQLLSKTTLEKDLFATQNGDLKDRLSQLKSKSSVEINALKKTIEDVHDQTKKNDSAVEMYRNQVTQKDAELRKAISEKNRLLEESKLFSQKKDALELTIDQLNATKNQFEEEIKLKSIQLAEDQQNLTAYQEATTKLNKIARQAEMKYITMKMELIRMYLEKTHMRLTVEINSLRELVNEASESTQPPKINIIRCIEDYEETVLKLTNAIKCVHDEGTQYIECLNNGRHLNSLPQGDIKIPSLRELSLAPILALAKPTIVKNHGPPMSMGPYHGGPPPPPPQSKFGRPYSFGQLGICATQRHTNEGPRMSMDPIGSKVPPRSVNDTFESSLKLNRSDSFLRMNRTPFGDSNLNSLLDAGTSGMSAPSPRFGDHLSGSRMDESSPRFGDQLGTHLGRSKLPEASSSFLNGSGSSFSEDFSKLGNSSESSPIPSLPFNGSSNASGIFIEPSFEKNQLFVGQLPWSFSEDNLKNLFGKFGEVVSAVIQTKGHSVEGKPVAKCGFVTFRTHQQRDFALQAGPMPFGSQNLTTQNKEIKRPLPTLNPSAQNPPKNSAPSSAFGLQSLVNASKNARTISTPTSTTPSKPKFQQPPLRGNSNPTAAIGNPKVVRPTPRPGSSSRIGFPGLSTATIAPKDDNFTNSGSYKRLMDECNLKYGTLYPESSIHQAIKSVREQNNNSLSGLARETILSLIEGQLQMQKRPPLKSSVAPWASTSQMEDLPSDQWRRFECNIAEEECTICMEKLNIHATTPLDCGHVFHTKCIEQWLSTKSDCPVCRKFALSKGDFPTLAVN